MESQRMRHLRTFADLLDTRFRGPLGLRFGVDAILGLVPVFGDMITAAMSFLILAEATLVGASPSVLLRMFFNVMVENVIGIIPIIGNVFDFFWKSNTRNMVVLESHLANPRSTQMRSRVFNVFFIIGLIVIFIAALVASFYLFKMLLELSIDAYESIKQSNW